MRSPDLRLVARWGLFAALVACGGRADSREWSGAASAPVPERAEVPPEMQRSDPDPAPMMGAGCAADGVWPASALVADQGDLELLRGCQRIAGDLTIQLFTGLDPAPLAALRVVEGLVTVAGDAQSMLPAQVVERPLAVLSSLEEALGLQLVGVRSPNLDALSELRTLSGVTNDLDASDQYGLWIEDCPGLTSLAGLGSLARVGTLQLASNPDLVSLRGLDSLREISRLVISQSVLRELDGLEDSSLRSVLITTTSLQSLAGLGNAPRLERLDLRENPELRSLDGATLGDSLQEVHLESNPALASLSGLAGVRRLRSFNITGAPALDTLAGLEQLEQVGNLHLEGLGARSLVGLSGLQQVSQLWLSANPQLSELTGLSSLREVTVLDLWEHPALLRATGMGEVDVEQLALRGVSLVDLTGLEQLRIAGSIEISEALAITSLNGLPQLGPDASLLLTRLPALVDTSALAQQASLGVLAATGTGLELLSGLSNLERLTRLELIENERLTQIEASERLRELSSVRIELNPLLRSLPAWSAVDGTVCADCAGFSLRIWSNPALETGPVLPALFQAVSITIANNSSLRELTGLSALGDVFEMRIINNTSLASLELPLLQRISWLDIHGNSALEEGLVQSLRQQVEADPSQNISTLSNSSGPALLDPCPWSDDFYCDEDSGACAPFTDIADCQR